MRIAFGVLVLAGCGRVGFDATTADARADGSVCTWGTPTRITELSTTDRELGAALHPDGRTIVFSSTRSGGNAFRLYAASRAGSTWSPPALIPALSDPADSDEAAWNAAGDRLYFSSFRSGPLLAYTSQFSGGVFSAPVVESGLAGADPRAPVVAYDELEMFFTSYVVPSHLERADRTSTAVAWQPRGAVTELDAPGTSGGWASLTSDALTIYFESDRAGSTDIYRATRPSRSEPFGTPVPVDELNQAVSSDGDPDISPDGSTMVLTSDRDGPPGNHDLYIATLQCE